MSRSFRNEAQYALDVHALTSSQFISESIESALTPLMALRYMLLDDSVLLNLTYVASNFAIMSGVRNVSHHNVTGVSQQQQRLDRLSDVIIGNVSGKSSPYVLSVGLAPLAIVTVVSPLQGNQGAIGHSLLMDPNRISAAVDAILNKDVTVSGPLILVQGGYALIARLPVFIPPSSGFGLNTTLIPGIGKDIVPDRVFWGFCTMNFDFDAFLSSSPLGSSSEEFSLTKPDGTNLSGHNPNLKPSPSPSPSPNSNSNPNERQVDLGKRVKRALLRQRGLGLRSELRSGLRSATQAAQPRQRELGSALGLE